MIDFYELLDIKKDATEQEIKTAYRKMAKKYHPDINKSDDANKIIISLNEAKETLLDDNKRREYDLLLDDINQSKQFSKNKEETYKAKTEEYKDNYSNSYITRWQFFINYLKNGNDKLFIKLFKILLVSINYVFFKIIKAIVTAIIYILYLTSNIIDYLAGIILVIGCLSLFITNQVGPNYIPFIPANIENFIFLLLLAFMIELVKELFIKKSLNIFVITQNIEDKIFVKILA